MVKCNCCRKEVKKPLKKFGKKFCCEDCIKTSSKKKIKAEGCEFC